MKKAKPRKNGTSATIKSWTSSWCKTFWAKADAAEGLLVDRMGDPRFRGVYFLLATLLPLDAAKELREKLIQYAADTKDNTVSNTFVQLLRTR